MLSDPALGILMLVLFLAFLMLGFPIAFTLMALGVGFGYITRGDTVFQLFVQRTYSVMANDVLISIPLFLFMGYVVERANILDRLFRAIQLAAGWVPGSLAVATLITCAMFATATGIVGAVVTLMGLLAFPAMLRAGYDTKIAAGVVCAGGCLGILIPPSVMLILYGATAGVSVVKLYAAAFVPGLMLTSLYIAYVVIRAMLNPAIAPKLPPAARASSVGEIIVALATSFFPLAVLIVGVLGAIVFGLATPSEAAAVGAAGAILLAVAYRSFSIDKLKESVFLTARASAMVCWLFVGSAVFSAVFALLGGQQVVENFVLSLNLNSVGFLLLTQAIIFVLGWPLEWTEIIVIFLPVFLPLLDDFGVDPIFFGVLVALNLQTSFLSPPVAMAPFYLKGVAPKNVSIEQIFSGVMPFLYIVILSMILMYLFPGIALWLPRALYG
ncbi:MAG: TRAP transporter large permease subunit [Pseudomonadota bacterium]